MEKWRNLNKKIDFSSYDYIFRIIKSKQIHDDIFFAFLDLFWPQFIIYKNYVFLKENFSEKKFQEMENSEKIEFWMNFLLMSPYFEDDEFGDKKAEDFTQSLMKIWQIKLNKEYPDLNIYVEYLHDSESSDLGLTFYQKNIQL